MPVNILEFPPMNVRISLLLTVGILSILVGCKGQRVQESIPSVQESIPSLGDSKYDSVMALTEGIEVLHSPEKVLATKGGGSGFEYTWAHKTSVRSLVGDLTVVEFGCFAEDRGKWIFSTYTGEAFTADDFEEWYSCPKAVLVESMTFTDPSNWTGAVNLHESASLWYYIGVSSSGEKYRGVGKVENLAQVEG